MPADSASAHSPTHTGVPHVSCAPGVQVHPSHRHHRAFPHTKQSRRFRWSQFVVRGASEQHTSKELNEERVLRGPPHLPPVCNALRRQLNYRNSQVSSTETLASLLTHFAGHATPGVQNTRSPNVRGMGLGLRGYRVVCCHLLKRHQFSEELAAAGPLCSLVKSS